jgi:hypothetical protein
MRLAWRVTELLALPTIGLGVALALAPDRAKLAVHVWLLVVLGLSLVTLLTVVHSAYPSTPSPFAASLRRPAVPVERPGSLTRLEREVTMAGASAFDVHYRLRPGLVELAAGLLSSRRGIDLEREPIRSRTVLGDDAWELVRPHRPPPTQRLDPGITAADLARVVTALEQV